MSVYLSRPKSARHAGVFILHAWWGFNDFIKDLCNRFARLGNLALAPDLYDGAVANTIPEEKKLRTKINIKVADTHILDSIEQLQREILGNQVGLMGFSLGANWSLRQV
jgi:carboxymethylenebutenolidase